MITVDEIDDILNEIATADEPQLTDDEWDIIVECLLDKKEVLN